MAELGHLPIAQGLSVLCCPHAPNECFVKSSLSVWQMGQTGHVSNWNTWKRGSSTTHGGTQGWGSSQIQLECASPLVWVTLLVKKFPFNPQEGVLSFSAMSLNDSVTADNENDQDEDTEKWWCGRSLYQIGQALLRQWLSPFELCELADPKPELVSTHVRFTVFQRALWN